MERKPSMRNTSATESPAAALASQAAAREPSSADVSPALPALTMRKQDLQAAPAAFRVRCAAF